MNTPIRILCLEDDKNDVELNITALEKDGVNFIHTQVDRQDKFFDQLQTQKFDIIISDYKLPGFTGMEVFRLTKQKGFDIPFIIVSGSLGEAVAIESLKEGVTDYVLKDNLKLLAPAIRRAMDEKKESRRRKQAEEELVRKERLLSESQRIAHIGSWTYDMAGNITWTEETYRIYGVAPDTFIPDANSFINLIHPDDRTAMQNWIDRCVVGEKPGELEFRIVSEDGSVRYLRGQGEINYDAENKPFYITGTVQDITERKRIEEEVRTKQELFQKTFNVSPMPSVLSKLPERTVLDVNPAFEQLFGYTRDEIIGKSIMAFDLWANASEREQLQGLVKSGHVNDYEFQFKTKSGETGYGIFYSTLLEQFTDKYVLVKIFDITERKRAEETIQKNEEVLRLFVEHSPASIAMFDKEMKYIIASHRYLIDYDLGVQNVVGRSHYEIFPEMPERWKEIHKRCLAGATEKCEEDPFPRTNGKLDWVRWEIRPWFESHGELGGIILFSEVITERKQTEEALRKSEHRYRSLMEHASDAIVVTDATGKILDVNTAATDLLGYTRDELLQMKGNDFFTSDELSTSPLRYAELLSGKNLLTQRTVIRKDGSRVPVETNSKMIVEGLFQGIIRDISERKRAEEEIITTNKEIRALNRIITTSSSTLDTNEILDKILVEALEIVGLEGGTVCLVEPDDTLKLIAQRETSDATILDLTTNRIKIGDCLCGSCAYDCIPLILPDRKAVLEYSTREALRGEDIRFHAAYPFIVKEKCVGVICVFTRTDKKPSKRNLKLLETLASQVALAIENSKLYQDQVHHIAQLHNLTSHLQTIREEERKTIAREIHDELGQSLTGLKMYISGLQNKIPRTQKKNHETMSSMSELIDSTIQTVRKISSELRPSILDDFGLIAAIEWQVKEFESRTGIKCKFKSSVSESEFDQQVALPLFRILQEALTNIARHAKAKHVEVDLHIESKQLILTIHDDGVGATQEQLSNPKSFGIIGMKERVFTIGGEVSITSRTMHGTSVVVKVPMAASDH